MVQTKDAGTENSGNSQVRLCEIVRASGSCGFNLTKSKWDPYPWVSNVEYGSPADNAGVQPGDCLLEVNGEDVLGLRVVEVANKVKTRDERVTVMLWNSGVDPNCTPETLCCGPMPINLQRLSSCMNNILAALECPVCLDTIPPPANQCANGHLICLKCRVKTDKCPVCRLKLFRGRSLLADQVYNSLIEAFDLKDKEESKQRKMLKHKLQGHKYRTSKSKQDIKMNFLSVPTNKILSRLLKSGKSSSAENLTDNKELSKNLLKPTNDFGLGLRTKSLSSNEIFRLDDQPVSRSASILSSRPGSGLIDVQSELCSRPVSCHGSMEELQKVSMGCLEFDQPLYQNSKCYCPCDRKCQKKISAYFLLKHIQQCHDGPLLYFFKPQIELSLPLTYESTTTLIITSFNTIFFVKILDLSCESKNNNLWVWSLNSKHEFVACATFESNGLKVTSEYPVLHLESTGWEQINKNFGILLNLTEGTVKLSIHKVLSINTLENH